MNKSMLTRQDAMQPFQLTCGRCGGEAWVISIPSPKGTCLCSHCTFGKEGLSLGDMLKLIFGKKETV